MFKLSIYSFIYITVICIGCKKNTVSEENCCNNEFIKYVDYTEDNFLFLPQAFSPNMDAQNDYYVVTGRNILEGELTINYQNSTIYSTSDIFYDSFRWTGINLKNNRAYKEGKYVAYVKCKFKNGKEINLSTPFCLITECNLSLKKCVFNDQINFREILEETDDPLVRCK